MLYQSGVPCQAAKYHLVLAGVIPVISSCSALFSWLRVWTLQLSVWQKRTVAGLLQCHGKVRVVQFKLSVNLYMFPDKMSV